MENQPPELLSHLAYLQGFTDKPAPESVTGWLDAYPETPPFLKALLIADGTVTLLLRAYFNENIRVRTLGQSMQEIPAGLPLLRLRQGDGVFIRHVSLTGESSGRRYAGATSLINPAMLDEMLFSALIDENVGMGEVLRNSAKGSYRELLHVTADSAKTMSRTYAVFLEQKPAILITERFELAAF